MSAWLNTVSGSIYKDIMEVFFNQVNHSENKQANYIKVIVLVLGCLSVSLIFFVEKLGSLLQLEFSLIGMTYGAIMSLFTLGMFFPRANVKGAAAATMASLVMGGWIILHAQYYMMTGKLHFPGKFTSIDNCPSGTLNHSNSSLLFTYHGVGSPVVADSSVALIYQMSFIHYVLLSTLCGVITGVIVSLLTEPPDYPHINPDVFSSYVHRFLPKNVGKSRPNREEYKLSVPKNVVDK